MAGRTFSLPGGLMRFVIVTVVPGKGRMTGKTKGSFPVLKQLILFGDVDGMTAVTFELGCRRMDIFPLERLRVMTG